MKMEQAIHKAAALVEAYEYIRRFDNKTVVVKVGGSIMDEPQTLRSLMQDLCFMHAVGMRPVVVHGGGKGITQAMHTAGLEAHFVHGHRYTDERTLAIAEHVLVNDINKSLVRQIAELGPKTMGLHSLSSCAVFGKRMYLNLPVDGPQKSAVIPPNGHQPHHPPQMGRKIDIGLVGQVEWVNGGLIQALLEARYLPVIAPIVLDFAGGKLNVNADSVAGHVAAALKAEKLVLVSDTHGIRTAPAEDSFVSTLTKSQIQQLVQQGVITSGMLPKVEAAITALQAGVHKVHIINGRIPHSLMLEVYTSQGIGTEIVLDHQPTPDPASSCAP